MPICPPIWMFLRRTGRCACRTSTMPGCVWTSFCSTVLSLPSRFKTTWFRRPVSSLVSGFWSRMKDLRNSKDVGLGHIMFSRLTPWEHTLLKNQIDVCCTTWSTDHDWLRWIWTTWSLSGLLYNRITLLRIEMFPLHQCMRSRWLLMLMNLNPGHILSFPP